MRIRWTHWVVLAAWVLSLGCQLFTPGTPTPAAPTEALPDSSATRTAAPSGLPTATRPPLGTLAPTPQPPPVSDIQSCRPEEDLDPDEDGLGDPYFPGLGAGGLNVTDYDIQIDFDLEQNNFDAVALITAVATQDLDRFNLDFLGFDINDLTINDQPAEFARQASELTVTPEQTIPAGETFTVRVAYAGTPRNVQAQGMSLGWNRYDNGFYVASEPSGASAWYPVNDHPCDKAAYTFRITVPEPYMVAANGTLVSQEDLGDRVTYTWEEKYPMASYLATVNVAEFEYQEQTNADGVLVRNYFDQAIAESVEPNFRKQPEMIEFFSDLYGPYPFDAYGVVVVEGNFGFALETQTLSLFSSAGLSRLDRDNELVVAHELAHQWFGNSVTLNNWKDIWLNEGFATYSQWLWLEHTSGKAPFERQVSEWYDNLKNSPHPPPGDPSNRDLFNYSVYFRGALTLHALRLYLGDSTFFSLLRAYAGRYRYGNVETKDFIALAEEVSGLELDDFFDAWLYAKEIPPKSEITP